MYIRGFWVIGILIFFPNTSSSSAINGGGQLHFVRQSEPRTPDCSGTCQFQNSAGVQPLMSCDGNCVCASKPSTNPEVGSPWSVIWNGTICTISESGPCGRGEGGMVMACQPELLCVEKRCRDRNRIKKLDIGSYCDDSLDCQSGLACVSEENVRPVVKKCGVLPKKLFRIWK